MQPDYKSIVPGIVWPAFPNVEPSARLATLFGLEQSQWWSEEKIREHQYQQLKLLLKHCAQTVPYYREVLPAEVVGTDLDDDLWRSIPILTRDTVQARGKELIANPLPRHHGEVSRQFTSGSTGKPVEVYTTEVTRFFWNVMTLRDHFWHRRNFDDRLAVIRRSFGKDAENPDGIAAANWGPATLNLVTTGPTKLLSIFKPVDHQARWLQAFKPDILLTNPSVLQDLAMYCKREGIDLSTLKEVRTLSEALPDGLRELCQEVWGVKLVDNYSSMELGYLALQCPENEHYHVMSEGVMIEVLDDHDQPCKPGESGRIVITNLHNYATPLIRYELGDIVTVGEKCSCGRGLPVISKIQGRYRGMITLPNGERSWPDVGLVKMQSHAPIQQFQVVQHSLDDISVKLVLPRSIEESEKQSLIAMFHETFRHPFNIEIIQVDTIPRSKGGKYEEFVSEIDYNPGSSS